jgi:hypothetical protein
MSSSKHLISLATAKKLTKNYREKKKKILKDEYGNTNTLCTSETFDRDIFDSILAQDNCTRLRFYFAMNEAGEIGLTCVGVNEQNEDILPKTSGEVMTRSADTVPIGGGGEKCPPECPPPSALYP